MIGSSRLIQGVRQLLIRLAPFPWRVRVQGASGTGKQVAARELHRLSPRHERPFVSCYLNAVSDELVLGDLCGSARGAFTGACSDRPGKLELAHQSTLLPDEIGAASSAVQLKLLQVLEDKAVQRLGDHRYRPVDVRFVFATNVDLEAAVREGRLREDLYHRLGELVVWLTPLAAHREDIPELVEHFLRMNAAEAGVAVPALAAGDLRRLMGFGWPGNVRQLIEFVRCYLAEGRFPPFEERRQWRRRLDEEMARLDGNVSAVARALQRSRTTIYRELEKRRTGPDVCDCPPE